MNSSSSETSLTVEPPSETDDKGNESRNLFQPGFEIHEAAVTLSSKEGCAFRVPSITLCMASGFFRTMLTLPQGQHEEEIIQLEEPTRVVDTLLRIVCCVGIDIGGALATIDDLSALLFAAEKYEVPGATCFARASILDPRFLQAPLQVYYICCRYGWRQEAQHIAQYTLALDFTDKIHRPILDSLSGTSLMALLDLRWRRKAMLKNILESNNTFRANSPYYKCTVSACGTKVEVGTIWREVKWTMLNELERDSSGESLKLDTFMQSAPVVALFQRNCHKCYKQCFSKEDTVKAIFDAIDSLPRSIAFETLGTSI